MDEDGRREPSPIDDVDDVDRGLLQLLAAGRSTVEAGELMGLSLAATALRLQSLREALGVVSTAEAVEAVCGGDPPSPPV